jgi:hypothetical protein
LPTVLAVAAHLLPQFLQSCYLRMHRSLCCSASLIDARGDLSLRDPVNKGLDRDPFIGPQRHAPASRVLGVPSRSPFLVDCIGVPVNKVEGLAMGQQVDAAHHLHKPYALIEGESGLWRAAR